MQRIKEIGKKGLMIAGFALSSVGLGSLATYVSQYLHSEDLTGGLGAYVTGYGYPESWLIERTVIYPGSPITQYIYHPGLRADIAFWTLLVGVPISIGLYGLYKWYKSRKA